MQKVNKYRILSSSHNAYIGALVLLVTLKIMPPCFQLNSDDSAN